jgi:rod shape-determining protein MreD
MVAKIKIFIIIFLSIILQVSFSPALTGGRIIPDIVLVLIVLWSGRKKFEDIWLWVLFGGLILDIAVFGKIGINAISFLLISFVTSLLQERFFIVQRTGSFLITLAIVAGTTVVNLMSVDILSDFYINISLIWIGAKIIGNLVVAIFFYIAMLRFGEIFGIRERKLLVR